MHWLCCVCFLQHSVTSLWATPKVYGYKKLQKATESLPVVASDVHFTPSSVFSLFVSGCSVQNKIHFTSSNIFSFLFLDCSVNKNYDSDGAREVIMATTLFCPSTNYLNLWPWMRNCNCVICHEINEITIYCREQCLINIVHIVCI